MRTPGRCSRSFGTASRIAVSGFFEKPAPTPSQRREGSMLRRSMSAAISWGDWRSSAITAAPSSGASEAAANSASVSRPLAIGVSLDHIDPYPSSSQRAASGCATSGSSPAATPKPRPGSATDELRDALDVRRLREHVHRLHAAQPIAGLDQLSGVRRERRRVARHVDDALRLALDDPADDLLREPGARRIEDDDIRAPGLLDERADTGSRAARAKARVLDAVSLRVSLGIRDRLRDQLEAPDLACARSHRQADRPDPAVEVEDPFGAGESGEIPGNAVEALGHLGVGLEEGFVGELEAQPGDLFRQALGT